MSDKFKDLESHLFICTHMREDGRGCGLRGGKDLASEMKDWVKENDLKKKIKITKSGCLSLCDDAIAAVCYPEGKWYTGLRPKDADKLKEDLK
jgi:predicted metal-binding protein